MGAGAGAAAAIDINESSPHGTAIEKAQAELRRDLAVREELRRELEFLEKGGEILDFNFGESPSAHVSSFSLLEPPVDQVLKSGGVTANVVAGGGESDLSQGCVGGRAPDVDGFPVQVPPKTETGSPQSSSRLNRPNLISADPTWTLDNSALKKESECLGGSSLGPKEPAHAKRNRHRSQRIVNGHALPKQLEKVLVAHNSVVELESKTPPVTLENEAMVDMSYQILPQQSSHALASKWNGLIMSQGCEPANEIMVRCGPVLEQHATDPSSREKSLLTSQKLVPSSDFKDVLRGDSLDKERDNSSVVMERGPFELVERSSTLTQVVSAGDEDSLAACKLVVPPLTREIVPAIVSTIQGEGMETSHPGNQSPCTEKRERVISSVDSSILGSDRLQKVEKTLDRPLKADVRVSCINDTRTPDGNVVSNVHVSTDMLGLASRDIGTVRKTVGFRGGSNSRITNVERSAQEEKRVDVHLVKIQFEGGGDIERANKIIADAQLGSLDTNGASNSHELRAEEQARAMVGGIPKVISRLSNASAPSNCKYPGGARHREKEQDPVCQPEAERQRTDAQEKVNKEREDFILAEAEHLKAKRKLIEDRKLLKRTAELSKQMAHWDFVLEEMAWMANDFFQERLWKRAQAAHICRTIAEEKGLDEFRASELCRRQQKLASFCASAVMDFWHIAEAAIMKDKTHNKSWTQERVKADKHDTGAVPMDVDIPVTEEVSEKSLQFEKIEKGNISSIQKYAVRFLKALGFEKIGQAEAPATPERYWESSSSLDPFWEDRFSEESLFYVVPNGSMEAYRISVELETAKREKEVEEEHAAAVAEAEALAAAEAAEDFSNDAGSQEDEQTIFTAEEGRSHISKKKRKKILKTPGAVPKIEGSGLQAFGKLSGFSFRSSAFLNTDGGHPSPIVTGKRSFSGGLGSNLPGSIPVKRARSSAANLRPRATPFSTSPGTIGILQRQGLGSRSPQDDATDILDSSSRGEDTSDTPSSKLHGLGSDGTFITSKSKPKKKKMKSYSGLPGSRSSEGGISAGTPGKGSDGVSQDLLQYEQMKRKGDTHWTPINGADQSLDTPGTPGSQGLPGQQILKKQKLFKADTNSDAVPTSLIPTSQACQIQSKLVKQNSMRDRIRRARPNSKVVPSPGAGIGIPWSASEDQAIVALVNDLGQNWELVSDVLSSSSQIKGIYRKPKQCKERHKSLTERPGSDGQENAEDPTSSQPQSLKQGNGRSSRIQISPEEDTLKHLEHLIQVATKYRMQKSLTVHSESEDQKSLADPHPSHASAMAQFFTGRPPNPLDLCDRVTNNGDVGPHSYPIQLSPGSVLCPPNPALPPGLGMRPPSGGLPPLLPGTNNLHLGQSSVTSSAAINAAAARDAQRFTMNKFSPEETNRLRMATNTLSVFNARRGQQQASATSGLPVLGGLPGPSDLSMLSTNGGGGMLGGLSRNLPLPRAGLPGMGSPLVPTLGPGGLSGMLPPSGSHPQTNMSRKISGLVKVVLGQGCSEEQRLQCLQQLQSLAQHGEPQAAQALSTLSGEMAMMPSPPQPFSPQHQHSLQLQQQQQQQQQHHQQQEQQQQRQQTQNQQHNQQAYIAAEVRMKDQQQQQQQQQQQKQRLPGPLPPTPQLQHMLAPPHQNSVTSLPPRHLASTPHVLSQQPHNSTQKKSVQQPSGGPSQMSQPALASSSLQTSPASPSTSGQPNLPPQQPSLPQQNQPPGQLSQGSGLGKPSQAKQTQKQPQQTSQQPQQQQASRSAKGPGRGSMMMQAHPPQGGLPSTNSGSLSGQPQDESPGQMQSGQRGQSQVGQVQGGKVHSGSQAGISGGSQSQGGQLQGGNQAQSSASVASQQKVLQQQQQTPQGGVSKQQQGSSSQQTVPAVSQQPTAQPIPSQQPTSSAPSTQQSQQLQRRQMSQPQPARRLQTRHLNTTMALPISGQIGKTGMQQTGQGLPSQMAAPPSHNLYQLGGTTALGNPMSMNNPNLHGMTFSSALNSSTVETNSTPWKLNQAIPPLSGGMYNLTRTNSAGSGQVPPLGSSGLHLPSSNGNSSMSALSSPGIHVGSPSMTQGLASMQGASGLHSQKAVNPVLNGRPLPGSQQGIVSGQRSPHMPVPVAMRNMVSSQMRPTVPPSVTGGLPSSTTGGVLQGMPSNGSFQGVPTAGPNHSAPMSSPMPLNGGQLRPPHGGHVPSLSQKPATTAASGSTSSGNTTPSTAGQAPLSSVETTPAASS